MGRTHIHDIAWLTAWDGELCRHRYVRGADLVFEDDTIVFAGRGWSGTAERRIDGQALCVMPGMVNAHGHLGTEPMGRGFFEELASPLLHMSRLYEYIYTVRPEPETLPFSTSLSIAELLLGGCTTVTDLGLPWPGWIDTVAATGVRGFLGAMFRQASWSAPNGHAVDYHWDEAGGERGFAAALDLTDVACRHPSGRIGALVIPAQVDTCTPALLQAAHRAARDRNLPFHTHLGQSVAEFHEMIRRHGKTPVEFLAALGVLDEQTTLAHAIFLDHHPWLHWPANPERGHQDLARLAAAGVTVAHCPQTFAYRGVALHHFGRYQHAGIRLAIGTDTTPHDMLSEMRCALLLARGQSGHVSVPAVSDVFHAATVGSAAALGRKDIGRLAPGAKADVVLVDLSHLAMVPVRDPLRSLVFGAGSRAVRDVFVDGVQVVEDREVMTVDVGRLVREVQSGQALAMARVPERDWAHREADAISPLSLVSE